MRIILKRKRPHLLLHSLIRRLLALFSQFWRPMAVGAVFLLASPRLAVLSAEAEERFRLLSFGLYVGGEATAGEAEEPLERIVLPHLIEETRIIEAAPCRLFGFVFDGPPEPVHVHVRHPPRPGPGGEETGMDGFTLPPLEGPRFVGFRFESAGDEVPGRWEFQIQGEKGEELREIFEVVASPASGAAASFPCLSPPLSFLPESLRSPPRG